MTSTKVLPGLGHLVVALAVVILLPASNVLLLMQPGFVTFEYGRPGFPPAERYAPWERLMLARDTVRFLTSRDPCGLLRGMRHGDEPVYNEREVQHLLDVVAVLNGLRWAWRLASAVLLVGLAGAIVRPGWRRPYARGALSGAVFVLAVLGAILFTALLDFDWFFVRFHRVFFAADTWLFAYEDSLIQFYPVEFWVDATAILGGATLLQAMVVAGLAYAWLARRGSKP